MTPLRLARLLTLITSLATLRLTAGEPPAVGDTAPDFNLRTLDGTKVRLRDRTAAGTVVLLVLRGWPGYQCPLCDRQVKDFIDHAAEFRKAGATLLMVYPGPAGDLEAHAAEFRSWKGREWPAEVPFVLDPDYTMVHAYALRWEAPGETAYPSTFVIGADNRVRFAQVSRSHGGRTRAADILKQLPGATP